LFEAANISKFAPEDKIKYEFDMTTERDIRNQIRYAEKKGIEKGMEKGLELQSLEIARRMLAEKFDLDTIVRISGLTEEQIKTL
jgi:predicted transposase/invertase (TIGR01784 family)